MWCAQSMRCRRGRHVRLVPTALAPKVVVPATLQEAEWENSTLLKGDAAGEIARLNLLTVAGAGLAAGRGIPPRPQRRLPARHPAWRQRGLQLAWHAARSAALPRSSR